jgi:hypothetical protein
MLSLLAKIAAGTLVDSILVEALGKMRPAPVVAEFQMEEALVDGVGVSTGAFADGFTEETGIDDPLPLSLPVVMLLLTALVPQIV